MTTKSERLEALVANVSVRRLGTVVAMAASMALLAACGSGTPATGESGDLVDIEIAVTQWPSLVFSVPYHVAIEKGFFADEGINVTNVISAKGGGTDVRAILGGDLAFGEAATSAVANAYIEGAPLVAVGGGVQAVGDIVWVAPNGSGIKSIDDLSGHSAGFTNPGSVTQSVLAISLDRAGVSNVDMRATGGVGEGLTVMAANGVDTTIHAEPLFSAVTDDFQLLWRATDFIEEYQQTVVVTSPALLKSDPELVKSFLRARAAGVQYMIDHPEESAEIWAEKGEVELVAAQGAIKALLAVNEWGVGFSAAGLETAEEGMHIAGILKADDSVPWDEIVNQDFLPDNVEPIDLR